MKANLLNLKNLPIQVKKWDRIFLYGDLWAGKTTLVRHILWNILGVEGMIKSPTYVYYNKYQDNIFHFDLYRINDYEEFINIGWEEILDNDENICIIEWPEILGNRYEPTLKIQINKIPENEDEREFIISQ